MDGCPDSLPVEQGEKTITAEVTPASLPTSDTAQLLADRYFELLDRPKKHDAARETSWPRTFDTLLQEHQHEDLLAIMEWALNVDTFWPKWLLTCSGDPAAYFAEKCEAIDRAWRRATHGQRNLKNHHNPPERKSSCIDALFAGSDV
jgi:hypothetical protein